MYWLTVIDWYCAGLSLMVVAFLEIVCIAWVYGKYITILVVQSGFTINHLLPRVPETR